MKQKFYGALLAVWPAWAADGEGQDQPYQEAQVLKSLAPNAVTPPPCSLPAPA